MLSGGCLCGAVRYQLETVLGPFELCHCARCRKATGSAFASMVGVATKGFKIIQGVEHVRAFRLPVVERPPGYSVFFCDQCGSPLPDPVPQGDWFEIPAGSLDDDPGVRPDKHIYVDCKAQWDNTIGDLPQFTKQEIRGLRRKLSASQVSRK